MVLFQYGTGNVIAKKFVRSLDEGTVIAFELNTDPFG